MAANSIRFYLINLFLVLFLSCNKNEDKLLKVINWEATLDFKTYVENISTEYKNLLIIKYKTSNERILIDSIKAYKLDFYDKIKKGNMILTNHVLKEVKIKNSNASLIKYRVELYDVQNDSKVFKEKVIIKELVSGSFKFIPYEKVFIPNIDSLLQKKFDSELLITINQLLKLDTFSSEDSQFYDVKNRFEKYCNYIQINDSRFVDFVYPSAYELIVSQNGSKRNDEIEYKRIISEALGVNKKNIDLKNSQIYIQDFYKINCVKSQDMFFLKYAIEVKPNIYIPGKILVISENNQLYFIEYNDKNFKEELPNLFEQEIMNCIEQENKK